MVYARKLLQYYWRIRRGNTKCIIAVSVVRRLRRIAGFSSLVISMNSSPADMSLTPVSTRKNHSLEKWRYYGGSLDRFDQNKWRQRGLYEDLSNATKCGSPQVSVIG